MAVGTIALVVALAGDDEPTRSTARAAPRAVPVANVQVGQETEVSTIQSATTPVLAANPTNPDNYAIGYRIERPRYSCQVAASFDAGKTWAPAALALPAGTERCYTTSLAFDAGGALHLVFVTLAGEGNVPSGAWLSRSDDGGRTFSPATRVLDKERFMVRLAVDPAASPARMLLTWVESSGVGLLQMAPPSRVMAAVSSDGGATFSQPVQVNAPQRERVGAPVPVVGARGAPHVLFYDYGKDVFDFQNVSGRYQGTVELVLASSGDGGRAFTERVVDAAVRPPEPFLVFTPPFPSLAADRRSGHLYAAWSDGRSGDAAALLAVSSDEGRTWSAPRRVDDGDGRAFLPQVSVATDGRLDVVYAREAQADGGPTEIRFTSSSDKGRMFGPAQALNRPFLRSLLPLSPRRDAGPDLGSALAVVSGDGRAYVAWPDTRRGAKETLRADIVGAPVRVTAGARARRLPQIVPERQG